MTTYGYARVSARTQSENRQIIEFEKFGIKPENIIVEKASGKNFIGREEYINLRAKLLPNDTLVVLSLDRLGRNYSEVKEEWHYLTSHKIDIEVIDMPILSTKKAREMDLTGNFINNLIIEVLSYVADNERRKIRERQKQGIEGYKKTGKTKTGNPYGRPKKTELDKKFVKYVEEGRRPSEIQALCKITKPTYYAWLKLYKEIEV